MTGVEVLLHVNPKGIRPLLGGLDTWPGYTNAEYGVRLRYPATFVGDAKWEYATMQSNFAGQEPPSSVQLFSASIPQNVYPDSNFVDGGFAVWIDTNIHAAGTCGQFREFMPQYTSSMTVAGTHYAYTSTGFVATGTAASAYTFHTFHNGLCYEFAFAFAEADGTGIELKCATQWMSEDNSFELMNAVLSQVSFSTPEFKAVPVASPNKGQVPAVVSFEHSPLDFNGISTNIKVSWKTRDADYVQLRYHCVKNLLAGPFNTNFGTPDCGKNWTNFPPDGSIPIMIDNFNSEPLPLVLTIEPFLNGIGYPKQAKTISIPAAPQGPHLKTPPQETEQK